MKPTHTVAIGCLLSCLASCGGTGTGTGEHTVTDSAGVRIVVSHASSWGTDGAYLDTLPALQIGSEEPGPYQFSFVAAGVLLPDGNIAVTELGTNEVRLFSPDGGHLRTLGRRGRGPGEFQLLSGLFAPLGDSLVTHDQVLRQATLLPMTGGTARVIGNPLPGNLFAFGAMSEGQLLLYNPGSGYRPGVAAGLQWDTTDVVLVELATGTGRVIARKPSRQQFVEPDGNTRPLAPAHGTIQAASRDGFYWATSDRYEIQHFTVAGQLDRIIRRPVTPRPVTPVMIEEWIAANLDLVRQREGEAAVEPYRSRLTGGTHGDQVPLFEQALVDQDQRLWVGEAAWPRLDGTPLHWSVFSPDGRWLSDVTMPPGFRPLDVRDDRMLGVWSDANGVPHVQLRHLIRP